MTDHLRECGPKVEQMIWGAEVESRAQRLEVELRDPQTKAKLMNRGPKAHLSTFVALSLRWAFEYGLLWV